MTRQAVQGLAARVAAPRNSALEPEERVLVQRFPQYQEYATRTPRLVPRARRSGDPR